MQNGKVRIYRTVVPIMLQLCMRLHLVSVVSQICVPATVCNSGPLPSGSIAQFSFQQLDSCGELHKALDLGNRACSIARLQSEQQQQLCNMDRLVKERAAKLRSRRLQYGVRQSPFESSSRDLTARACGQASPDLTASRTQLSSARSSCSSPRMPHPAALEDKMPHLRADRSQSEPAPPRSRLATGVQEQHQVHDAAAKHARARMQTARRLPIKRTRPASRPQRQPQHACAGARVRCPDQVPAPTAHAQLPVQRGHQRHAGKPQPPQPADLQETQHVDLHACDSSQPARQLPTAKQISQLHEALAHLEGTGVCLAASLSPDWAAAHSANVPPQVHHALSVHVPTGSSAAHTWQPGADQLCAEHTATTELLASPPTYHASGTPDGRAAVSPVTSALRKRTNAQQPLGSQIGLAFAQKRKRAAALPHADAQPAARSGQSVDACRRDKVGQSTSSMCSTRNATTETPAVAADAHVSVPAGTAVYAPASQPAKVKAGNVGQCGMHSADTDAQRQHFHASTMMRALAFSASSELNQQLQLPQTDPARSGAQQQHWQNLAAPMHHEPHSALAMLSLQAQRGPRKGRSPIWCAALRRQQEHSTVGTQGPQHQLLVTQSAVTACHLPKRQSRRRPATQASTAGEALAPQAQVQEPGARPEAVTLAEAQYSDDLKV